MQETDPDSQAEPTLITIHQEQSHEGTEATEDKTHSEQENYLYKFQMFCPILLLLKEGEEEEVEEEHLFGVLHQEEVWVDDVQGFLQG